VHEVARIPEGRAGGGVVSDLGVMFASKTAEHLTPSWVLDLVEKVAPIGLDPCGHELAESSRRARACLFQGSSSHELILVAESENKDYHFHNDGLKTAWAPLLRGAVHNRQKAELVFVNPPYGRELKAWAAKMAAERDCAIIALVPARVDTAWWRELDPLAWCALAGRVKFLDSEGNEQDAAPFPSAVCLLHSTQLLSKFVEVFQERGPVYVRVHE